jgi:hypothetical protein
MAKGISNETRSTSLKKFKPSPKVNDGLCIAALTDVVITQAEITADSPMDTFRGMSIPRLNFIFESRLDMEGVKTSTYIHSFLPIEHTPSSLLKENSWKFDQLFGIIKHILDVYRHDKPFTKEEEVLMTVDFQDEDNGVFIEQPASIVIAAYEKFFNNIIAMFKPEGKAIYKDINGKDIIVWMKLLLEIKGKQINKGDYAFPGYVGEGVIEIKKDKVPPSLVINIAKGENIIPKAPTTAVPPIGATGGSSNTSDDSAIPSFLRQ